MSCVLYDVLGSKLLGSLPARSSPAPHISCLIFHFDKLYAHHLFLSQVGVFSLLSCDSWYYRLVLCRTSTTTAKGGTTWYSTTTGTSTCTSRTSGIGRRRDALPVQSTGRARKESCLKKCNRCWISRERAAGEEEDRGKVTIKGIATLLYSTGSTLCSSFIRILLLFYFYSIQ